MTTTNLTLEEKQRFEEAEKPASYPHWKNYSSQYTPINKEELLKRFRAAYARMIENGEMMFFEPDEVQTLNEMACERIALWPEPPYSVVDLPPLPDGFPKSPLIDLVELNELSQVAYQKMLTDPDEPIIVSGPKS